MRVKLKKLYKNHDVQIRARKSIWQFAWNVVADLIRAVEDSDQGKMEHSDREKDRIF